MASRDKQVKLSLSFILIYSRPSSEEPERYPTERNSSWTQDANSKYLLPYVHDAIREQYQPTHTWFQRSVHQCSLPNDWLQHIEGFMDRPVRGAVGWPLMPNPEILITCGPSVSSGDVEWGVACKIQRSCSSVPKKL
jgi:hypothetical protein